MNKFEWIPTECAPKNHPIEILNGDFLFENGEGIYIPDRRLVFNGWGEIGSIHLVGDDEKPVPVKLIVQWLSLTEDKFYSGNFELPKAKMEELFQKGFINPENGQQATYSYILVGLAPEGGIAIWLKANQICKEVCFLKAKAIEVEWKSYVANPDYPRSKYIKAKLANALTQKQLITLNLHGIPHNLWSVTYRKLYAFTPLVIGNVSAKSMSLYYYNGEREFIDNLSKKEDVSQRTVPNYICLGWKSLLGIDRVADIFFDEKEIFTAFEKLCTENQELNLQIEINTISNTLKVYLRNNRYILEIVKCTIKVF